MITVGRYAGSYLTKHGGAAAEAYVPLSFAPGGAYQFDWGWPAMRAIVDVPPKFRWCATHVSTKTQARWLALLKPVRTEISSMVRARPLSKRSPCSQHPNSKHVSVKGLARRLPKGPLKMARAYAR
jgi:hypothetical protein